MKPRVRLTTALAAGLLLAWAAPRPGAAAAALLDHGDVGTALAGLCGLLALLTTAALAGSAVLVLAASAPGGVGRAADALSRRCLPSALRAALVAALTLGSALAPALSAGAETRRPGAAADVLPDLDRPGSPALRRAAPAPSPAAAPSPAHRTAHRATPHPPRRSEPTVVVQPGDTLWQIAAEHLGPTASRADVAASWPHWWSANRPLIGPDPDLIHPGQRLRAPADPPVNP